MNKILTLYVLDKKQNSGLVLLGLLSVALLLLRVKLTHDIYLLFLIWNLFLGYIPYGISTKIKKTIPTTPLFYVLLVIWLLFLPNAFYLITDFVHLHHYNRAQFAFDALLLTSFTVAGFYAGILSLWDIHQLLRMKYTYKTSKLLIVLIIYLSAYGIYLGRILRFNSWDLLSHPLRLFYHSSKSLLQYETLVFTIALGTFMTAVYFLSYTFLNKRPLSSW